MNRINLNHICKIVLTKKRKSEDFEIVERSENCIQWFKNLFRKNKKKKPYFRYWYEYPNFSRNHPLSEMNKFISTLKEYQYNDITRTVYDKPCITMWYSDYRNGNEKRYFDTDKEAMDYFLKLLAYTKENNLPFIDFYSEK